MVLIDIQNQGTATASMTQQLVQELRDADLEPAEYFKREEAVKDATGVVYACGPFLLPLTYSRVNERTVTAAVDIVRL